MIDDTLHDHCACFGCHLTLEVLECKFVSKKTKLRISKRLLEENKANQISRKTNISHPLLCFVVSLVLISSLLSHYHRIYYGLLFVYIGYILLAVSTFHCRIWVLSDKFCFNSNRFCLNQNIARMNFVKNCGGALVDSFNSFFKHLIREKKLLGLYFVKSACIRSFSGPYFLAFGLNTERCRVSSCIQSELGKIRTRKTPNTDTFHAVLRGIRYMKYT